MMVKSRGKACGTISPCTPGTDGPAKGREREAFGPVLLILLRQNGHCAQLYLILRYSSCLQLQRCQKVDYILIYKIFMIEASLDLSSKRNSFLSKKLIWFFTEKKL